MNNEKETSCEKEYELKTWAKVAIYCIKGGVLSVAAGLACLGIGMFSKPIIQEKKNEGN